MTTPSAVSPITAQVNSRPGDEALDHDLVAERPVLAP